MLTCQISSECVQMCRFAVAKKNNFGQTLTSGNYCTDPLLPMRAKLQGLHLHAKFHLNVFIVSASGIQKPQFWANFDIWGLLYPPAFTDDGQM